MNQTDLPTTRLREEPVPAPCCGCPVSAATAINLDEPTRPEINDITICWNCGAWLVLVDKEGNLRRALPADLAEITPADFELAAKARLAVFIRGPIWTKEKGWLDEKGEQGTRERAADL